MRKLTLLMLINLFAVSNVYAITYEDYCMGMSEYSVDAARQFYETKRIDIGTARKLNNSIINFHTIRIERGMGKLGGNEMQLIGSINKYTKFGICEVLKKQSGLSLIKVNSYNNCMESLKRDFQMSNCLD